MAKGKDYISRCATYVMPKGKAGMNLPKHFGFHTEKNFHFWEQSDKERFTENTHKMSTITGTRDQYKRHEEVNCLTAKDGHNIKDHPLYSEHQRNHKLLGQIKNKDEKGRTFKHTAYFIVKT